MAGEMKTYGCTVTCVKGDKKTSFPYTIASTETNINLIAIQIYENVYDKVIAFEGPPNTFEICKVSQCDSVHVVELLEQA